MKKLPLQGKVAIVTGAGRGIGRSVALALASAGASVALAARTRSQIRAVQAEVRATGGRAACFPTDMAREEEIARLVAQTVAKFSRLDIVVNNAGTGFYEPLEETSARHWDELMAVNARGPFLLCREAIPLLRKNRRSFIVNIASVVAVKGYANQSAYSASKHALLGMSKAMAREVQKDGIRVHVVCPGGVDTEMVAKARPDLERSQLIKPGEIADLVLFLVTREGNAVTDEIHVRRESATPWA